jgi:[CysO sulfur-carrier protein]-S-L-cysteine hydrolase
MINSIGKMGNSVPTGVVRTIRSGEKVIQIPAQVRQQMVDYASAALPNEACGLLAGQDGRVETFFPIRNVHAEPQARFELDPKEYLDAMDQIDVANLQLTATFHSHTHTAAYPSPTDVDKSEGIQRLFPETRFVLVSLQDREPDLRAFAIVGDQIAEQEVRIV